MLTNHPTIDRDDPPTRLSPTDFTRAVIRDRFAGLPAWVVLVQLFFGFGWLRAVGEKLIDPDWATGQAIIDFTASHQEIAWYRPFTQLVVEPYAPFIAFVVLAFQIVAGMSLVSGRELGIGIGVGMFLNLHFLASGAVDPSAFYLIGQGALALWLADMAPTRHTAERLAKAAIAAATLALVSLPFISTLHPAEVIRDPAMMFVFGGLLAVLASVIGASRTTAN